MRFRSVARSTSLGLLLAVAVALLPAPAAAGDVWTIGPLRERAVTPGLAETFRDLLQSELAGRGGAAFVGSDEACADVPCAVGAGTAAKADVAIYGAVAGLGRKVVVTVTAVDVREGTVLSSQKMAVDRVEQLDVVASRMAEAILSGRSVDDTARLGTITREEAQPDTVREVRSGFTARMGGFVPIGDAYARSGFGLAMDAAYWFEGRHFAIEPRIGVRFSADANSGDHGYVEVPIDVAAFYILGLGDFAPFIGGGGGVRFLWEKLHMRQEVGTVVRMYEDWTDEDSAWGFGLFGRLGVLLFRTYSVRMSIIAEYGVNFVTIHGHKYPQAFSFGLGVVF